MLSKKHPLSISNSRSSSSISSSSNNNKLRERERSPQKQRVGLSCSLRLLLSLTPPLSVVRSLSRSRRLFHTAYTNKNISRAQRAERRSLCGLRALSSGCCAANLQENLSSFTVGFVGQVVKNSDAQQLLLPRSVGNKALGSRIDTPTHTHTQRHRGSYKYNKQFKLIIYEYQLSLQLCCRACVLCVSACECSCCCCSSCCSRCVRPLICVYTNTRTHMSTHTHEHALSAAVFVNFVVHFALASFTDFCGGK